MTEHTPTPWRIDGSNVNTPKGEPIAYCQSHEKNDYGYTMRDAEANAEFVVRACNNHDELVHWVEETRKYLMRTFNSMQDQAYPNKEVEAIAKACCDGLRIMIEDANTLIEKTEAKP